jgi:hypothetical protein
MAPIFIQFCFLILALFIVVCAVVILGFGCGKLIAYLIDGLGITLSKDNHKAPWYRKRTFK